MALALTDLIWVPPKVSAYHLITTYTFVWLRSAVRNPCLDDTVYACYLKLSIYALLTADKHQSKDSVFRGWARPNRLSALGAGARWPEPGVVPEADGRGQTTHSTHCVRGLVPSGVGRRAKGAASR